MKININNFKKVEAALNELEGRATVRKVSVVDLPYIAEKFEKGLILPKSEMVGVRINYTVGFGGKIPASYRYTPESTQVTLERFPSGWFLVGGGRGTCPTNDAVYIVSGSLTEVQKTSILKRTIEHNYI